MAFAVQLPDSVVDKGAHSTHEQSIKKLLILKRWNGDHSRDSDKSLGGADSNNAWRSSYRRFGLWDPWLQRCSCGWLSRLLLLQEHFAALIIVLHEDPPILSQACTKKLCNSIGASLMKAPNLSPLFPNTCGSPAVKKSPVVEKITAPAFSPNLKIPLKWGTAVARRDSRHNELAGLQALTKSTKAVCRQLQYWSARQKEQQLMKMDWKQLRLHAWLGWLMPSSHRQEWRPSYSAMHASWKCPPRAFATTSSTLRGGSRIARSCSVRSAGLSVL